MRSSAILALFALVACNSKHAEPATTSAAPSAVTAAVSATPAASAGVLRLGSAIAASTQDVALADVVKSPNAYVGKTFATTGTVTAVCQHRGCWMEIKDDASEAHVKMAGHAFFVPKTASGRKARVLAKLEKADDKDSCEGEGHEGMSAEGAGDHHKGEAHEKRGCRAEAEEQLGRPVAKLELLADGIELL